MLRVEGLLVASLPACVLSGTVGLSLPVLVLPVLVLPVLVLCEVPLSALKPTPLPVYTSARLI